MENEDEEVILLKIVCLPLEKGLFYSLHAKLLLKSRMRRLLSPIFARHNLDSYGSKILHADNEDSDQSARMRNLIRLRWTHMQSFRRHCAPTHNKSYYWDTRYV